LLFELRIALDGGIPVAQPGFQPLLRRYFQGLQVSLHRKVVTHRIAFYDAARAVDVDRPAVRLAVDDAEADLVAAGRGEVSLHGDARGKAQGVSVGQVHESAFPIDRRSLQADAVVPRP